MQVSMRYRDKSVMFFYTKFRDKEKSLGFSYIFSTPMKAQLKKNIVK